MRNVLSTALLSSVLGIAVIGCANQTESDKTYQKAERVQDAANMIKEGEGKVVDGEAMIKRGESTRDLGNRAEGEAMIIKGQATRDEGRNLINKGKAMRN